MTTLNAALNTIIQTTNEYLQTHGYTAALDHGSYYPLHPQYHIWQTTPRHKTTNHLTAIISYHPTHTQIEAITIYPKCQAKHPYADPAYPQSLLNELTQATHTNLVTKPTPQP